ncbi:CBS domain-containing protein [Pseudoalteromonas sp. SR43-6]|jgi:CBS domain containing-hemolysin-like protein|uniref:CBS domain-containing protein n=1 Tax=Pseudoalteromonas TaxID=53246 RepID=UPI0003F72B6F|nr:MULTISPECIES: CBS domain-containing protein [Pseudoalteromonas]KAA1157256.1 CBS domain-containing protein [Pseudoalteromonas distincta]MBB1290629.1 CBS domain-containing protein [Pseudoalteromonas sp. SR41-5]MBB1330654.1 CBS domain-containing protein [Pseudoalteromonas sp. SR43-7]MBB1338415.1 CBS domain-containing protein [Pseudoalteromonas sp. SR44-2]MBB1347412.1 CBS domain-containing protein [Pseudoalteromonas sp. SG45-2]|tara:strand:+ start:5707 stop:6288 length:582 start_codon:yes stop_codon:yes gene_type:complete
MSNFKELRTQNISHGVIASTFADDQPLIDLSSPALKMVNNFTQKTPIRAEHGTTITDALKQVSAQQSDFVLVTDEHQKLIGLVSSADLQSSKITIIAERLNMQRSEVSLRDIMTPVSRLTGVSMQSLSYACIGDALQTMEHQGTMFLLVTTASNEICGLISARQIAKTLHIPVHISPIAHSFSEVLENIEHPH